ncbi:MAG: hypothetical protein AAF761_06775 [Pseudomonadota bacterium]
MRDKDFWHRVDRYPFAPYHPPKRKRRQDGVAATELGHALVDEHNWTVDYTDRAIEEYRRFIYLSSVSEFHVTPSQVVDLVWHAHMADSEEYHGFTVAVAGRLIHHNPCIGPEEMPRYDRQYLDTGALYRAEFGMQPPPDIWDFRTRPEIAGDDRQRRRSRWIGTAAGFATAIGLAGFALAFDIHWLVTFGLFVGAVTGMIVTGILDPKVPGPQYQSSDGGGSGCGD